MDPDQTLVVLTSLGTMFVGLLFFLSGGVILWLRYASAKRMLELAIVVLSLAAATLAAAAIGGTLRFQVIAYALLVAVFLGVEAVINVFKLPGEIRRRPKELLVPAVTCFAGLFLLCLRYLGLRVLMAE